MRRIPLGELNMDAIYAVLDLLGKSVSSGKIENSHYLIPMAKAGVYIVKVGNVSQKVLVK